MNGRTVKFIRKNFPAADRRAVKRLWGRLNRLQRTAAKREPWLIYNAL